MLETTPQRRGLAIVRCGRNSLHASWREGPAAAEWDLQLVPYQSGEPDWPQVVPGHKWDGLFKHLQADRTWERYDYIWLPDDDLATDAATVARFFEACRHFGAALAQPALTEDSYWSLVITMRNRAFAARATSYVECMAPCFRRDVLERMLPTFDLSWKGAGWGLDFIWAKLLQRRDIYIFDQLAMHHTRPVGTLRDKAFNHALRKHQTALFARHEIRPLLRTLRGYDADGTVHEADHGPFLLRYLQGYDYLVQQDPNMLQRLYEAQTVHPRTVRTRWRRLTQNLRWPRHRRKAAPSASAARHP